MCESLTAHASRRSRRSLLSMRLLCFNKLDLILRRPPTGRANARPMAGSVAVSKDGLQYRFVIPGTSRSLDAVWFRERPPGQPWSRYRNARAPLADVLFPTIGVHNNAWETDMPILAKVGGLAILAGAGAPVFFFGGFYSVAGTAEDPAAVTWALTQVRTASIHRHSLGQPPASLNDPASVQARAKAFAARSC